jgi:DNA-binding CsgD family transcriptional regulator
MEKCVRKPKKRGRAKRRSRAKLYIPWEQAVIASGGYYAQNLRAISARFPQLTPMERRVAALVKAMLPSWRIAEMLLVKEETVERYRCRIRRKLGLHGGWLQEHLATI